MVYDKRESCKGYIKEEISMPRTKTTKAAVTKTTKAAATEKTTPVKTEETVKTEEVKVVETKPEETKAEETKKAASAKKEPVKRATRKRTTTTKKTAIKTVTKRVNIQFGGKDLKIEEIEAAIKKAWMDETGKKETEIEKLEIYIKPEESAAYYVVNGEYVEEGKKIDL